MSEMFFFMLSHLKRAKRIVFLKAAMPMNILSFVFAQKQQVTL